MVSRGGADTVAFSKLPDGLLERLEQAARYAEMHQITLLVDEIRKHNHQLADLLTTLASDFAYDKILAGIRQTGEPK